MYVFLDVRFLFTLISTVYAFVVKVQRINLLLPKAVRVFAFREAEFAGLRTETARRYTSKLSTLKIKPSSKAEIVHRDENCNS